jgi:ADP-heptose:LPS heptosyltransferase
VSRTAASVIAGAKAVVAIDNGLAHVAAALGAATIVLFGATSEIKNRPRGLMGSGRPTSGASAPGLKVNVLTRDLDCRPCQMTDKWESCSEWKCMGFEAKEVAAAVDVLLYHRDTEDTENGGPKGNG